MTYRPEIDGLRALAVFPVVLFHFASDRFSGGFIGVDIFFVISGYLITKIIYQSVIKNNFSFSSFYIRRIKRLLPALLVVTCFTYATSSLLYTPDLHKVVGQYVLSTVTSLSNILLYLKGTDYFGLDSSANPLYHTWSLSVEEQFYVIFPILLFIIYRYVSKWFLYFFITSFIASFLVSIWGSIYFPSANYFMITSRAWELLAGGICAIYVVKNGYLNNRFLISIGFFLILLSFFIIDNNSLFPGLITIIPVCGVVLIILNIRPDSTVSRLLSNKYIVFIGLISYSIYLWHLPLIIFMDYLFERHFYTFLIYLIFLFVLSYLSYKFIELPFRSSSQDKLVLGSIAIVVLTLSSISIIGHFNGGYPNRSALFNNLSHNNGYGLQCNGNVFIEEKCSSSTDPKYALLGNSIAMVWMDSLSQDEIGGIVQLTRDSCAVGYEEQINSFGSIGCYDFYKKAIKTINDSSTIEKVVISSPFDKEFSSLIHSKSFTKLLTDISNKSIIIIGPPPESSFNIGQCLIKKKLKLISNNCNFMVSADHIEKIEKINLFLNKMPNIKFIDITSKVCNKKNICETSISENNPIYIDNKHLSRNGAKHIYKKINKDIY